MERIGFVGLGRMGRIMAGRLLAAGFPLTIQNRTPGKAADLLARGAEWAESLTALADRSDMIVTCLTDDQAVSEVYDDHQGLLAANLDGKLCIEMSTVPTRTILALQPRVAAAGARLIDAPVSGSTAPAREGQLLILVGGEPADVARARPVLEQLGRRIVHLGPSGAGTTMKLVLNMPMAIFWAGLAEAMAIGQQWGLRVADMLDVYLDSQVAPPVLRAKAGVLLGEAQEVGFDITGVRKDLLAMTATGQAAGVPTPTGAAALMQFAAATAAGYGGRDFMYLIEYMAELARQTHPMPQNRSAPPENLAPDSRDQRGMMTES